MVSILFPLAVISGRGWRRREGDRWASDGGLRRQLPGAWPRRGRGGREGLQVQRLRVGVGSWTLW